MNGCNWYQEMTTEQFISISPLSADQYKVDIFLPFLRLLITCGDATLALARNLTIVAMNAGNNFTSRCEHHQKRTAIAIGDLDQY